MIKSFFKTIVSVCLIFVLGLILGQSLEKYQYYKPTSEMCGVYEVLIKKMEYELEQYSGSEQYPVYLGSKTIPARKSPFSDSDVAPSMFFVATGEYETKVFELSGEEYEMPIFEEKQFDTSSFFGNVFSGEIYSIKRCKFSNVVAPLYHDASFEQLVLKANLSKFRSDIRPTYTQYSVVGFSEDNRSAIVYKSDYCGGLCGQGGYELLEKIDNKWVHQGFALMWVS